VVNTLNKKLSDTHQEVTSVRTVPRKVSQNIIKNDESSLRLSRLFTNDTSLKYDSTQDAFLPSTSPLSTIT